MGKIVFTPVSIIAGLLSGLIASKLFELIWARVDDDDPPEPKQRDIAWPKLLGALLVEGAIFRAVRGGVDRGTRVAFHRATGEWPGETG